MSENMVQISHTKGTQLRKDTSVCGVCVRCVLGPRWIWTRELLARQWDPRAHGLSLLTEPR